jgi:hypothetical protein
VLCARNCQIGMSAHRSQTGRFMLGMSLSARAPQPTRDICPFGQQMQLERPLKTSLLSSPNDVSPTQPVSCDPSTGSWTLRGAEVGVQPPRNFASASGKRRESGAVKFPSSIV